MGLRSLTEQIGVAPTHLDLYSRRTQLSWEFSWFPLVSPAIAEMAITTSSQILLPFVLIIEFIYCEIQAASWYTRKPTEFLDMKPDVCPRSCCWWMFCLGAQFSVFLREYLVYTVIAEHGPLYVYLQLCYDHKPPGILVPARTVASCAVHTMLQPGLPTVLHGSV
jgi:hypothetical protein